MNLRIATVIFLLSILVVVGCTNSTGYGLTSHASFVGPQIGIVADGELRVIEVRPGSAAETAGVQVGDILLDLTWIPSDAPAYMPESSDVVYTDTSSIPLTAGERVTADESLTTIVGKIVVTSGMAVTPIPPPVESYIEKGTVPFTDSERIISLAGVGVPLKMRLKRGDQVLELTVTPTVPPTRPLAPNEPMATYTPVMPPYYYY